MNKQKTHTQPCNKKVAILVPHYMTTLTKDQVTRLRISRASNPTFPIYFILPESLTLKPDRLLDFPYKVETFPDTFFENTRSYNRLMLSKELYSRFSDFSEVIILQLDAILIRKISTDLICRYDYIGAPWESDKKVIAVRNKLYSIKKRKFFLPGKSVNVGNGGLSVRNVEAMISVVEKLRTSRIGKDAFSGNQNEDFIISYMCKKLKYRVPDRKVADKIFQETTVDKTKTELSAIGFHGLAKYYPDMERMILAMPEEMFPLNDI